MTYEKSKELLQKRNTVLHAFFEKKKSNVVSTEIHTLENGADILIKRTPEIILYDHITLKKGSYYKFKTVCANFELDKKDCKELWRELLNCVNIDYEKR